MFAPARYLPRRTAQNSHIHTHAHGIKVGIRGGAIIDRLSAASKLLGYTHSHRDLMIGRDIETPKYTEEVVWGRAAYAIPIGTGDDSPCDTNWIHPVAVSITILDTKKSRTRHTGEIVFVYGERIMHKHFDTTCPDYAMRMLFAANGYVFIDWIHPRFDRE